MSDEFSDDGRHIWGRHYVVDIEQESVAMVSIDDLKISARLSPFPPVILVVYVLDLKCTTAPITASMGMRQESYCCAAAVVMMTPNPSRHKHNPAPCLQVTKERCQPFIYVPAASLSSHDSNTTADRVRTSAENHEASAKMVVTGSIYSKLTAPGPN